MAMVADFLWQGGVMEPLKTWLLTHDPGALLPAASKMFDSQLNMQQVVLNIHPYTLESFRCKLYIIYHMHISLHILYHILTSGDSRKYYAPDFSMRTLRRVKLHHLQFRSCASPFGNRRMGGQSWRNGQHWPGISMPRLTNPIVNQSS